MQNLSRKYLASHTSHSSKNVCLTSKSKSIGTEYFTQQFSAKKVSEKKKIIFGFVFPKLHFHLPNQETWHEQDLAVAIESKYLEEVKMKVVLR